ncbi:hypothetical protein [Sporolactobacillus laevolacticus]|uniref:hypothetical protein n=1 Tax=Sporolactobacillus laevolacticus TaxID=33018 RepID=UPI0025B45960|nr:hypothetical protein [Sporolactobacillus laevolacticus]MDN3954583.1 hypothetical protein [Sporolactobacillus laevolacticus]
MESGPILGTILGAILGVLLLIVGSVSLLVSKSKGIENKWAWWVILFGCCAIMTAIVNSFVLL